MKRATAGGIAAAIIVTLLGIFAVPIGLVGMALFSVSFGGVGEAEGVRRRNMRPRVYRAGEIPSISRPVSRRSRSA